MSQSSLLTRYRPAVIAATGLFAGYGAYILYTNFNDRPEQSALHRSNAVHRARRNRDHSQPNLVPTRPQHGAPFGEILISCGDNYSKSVKVGVQHLPSNAELRQALGSHEIIDPRGSLEDLALDMIMIVCRDADEHHGQDGITALGLAGITEVIRTGNVEEFQIYKPLLQERLGGVASDRLNSAFRRIQSIPATQYTFSTLHDPNRMDTYSYSTPDIAETEEPPSTNEAEREPSQGLKGLLYYVAEENAKRKAYEHRGIMCEECGENPIRNVRWHCLNCPDFDLCSTCEASTIHPKTHVFVKIKIPLPTLSQPSKEFPIWYPGDPRKLHGPLRAETKKRLSASSGFEETQIDAFYDQFACIANTPWPQDQDHVHAAIDRRAFDKAMTSDRWENRFAPNALFDRTFAFYDTNGDSLIGFQEFVSGLAYLRGDGRYEPLTRALRGYDIDGTGYLDRFDILRLLRAKYAVQKQLISDIVEGHEPEQTLSAMDTLRSSQPISSVFAQEDIPPGEERPIRGKTINTIGDLELAPETKAILDDEDACIADDEERFDGPQWHSNSETHPSYVTQEHLSRFEEMLYGHDDEPSASGTVAARIAANGLPADDSTELTAVEHTALERLKTSYYTLDEPLNQEILWQVVEEGFQQMLDPLFEEREKLHDEVRKSKEERQRWRKEIDKLVEENKAWQKELQEGAQVDPLLATALQSQNAVQVKPKQEQKPVPPLRQQAIPTDPASLEQMESEITKKPLQELLEETGYSTVDPGHTSPPQEQRGTNGFANDAQLRRSSMAALVLERLSELDADKQRIETSDGEELLGVETILQHSALGSRDGQLPLDSSTLPTLSDGNEVLDPTMPQNRPNAAPPVLSLSEQLLLNKRLEKKLLEDEIAVLKQEVASLGDSNCQQAKTGSSSPEQPPSRARLEHLLDLNEEERVIRRRGGPGKLSFDEIEGIVKADSTRELRGLIVSWLEWASF